MELRCAYVRVNGARARRADDGHGGPGAVVIAGTRPSPGRALPVDPLDEVADVGVAQRRREPFGGALAPDAVGAQHHDAAVLVEQGQLEEQSRVGHRPPLPAAVPPVQHPDRAGAARGDGAGQVDRPRVLLVGEGEARPAVDRRPVHEEAVGVGGRDVGRGAPDGARRRVHLGPQVGHTVRLRRRGGGPQPLALPVAGPQRRREAGRGRHRPQRQARAAGLHRPLERRLGRQRRAPVGHEGLTGRGHGAAVPDDRAVTRIGPAQHDAVPGLHHLAPACTQRPGERAVVGVDADGVDGPVDRQTTGVQGPGRGRRRVGACERPPRPPRAPAAGCRAAAAPAATAPAATPAEEARNVRRPKRLTSLTRPDPRSPAPCHPASA